MKKPILIMTLGCAALALGAVLAAADAGADAHEDAESSYAPGYLSLATGAPKFRAPNAAPEQPWATTISLEPRAQPAAAAARAYPWPVSLSFIGHTIASYQNYSRLPGSAYFHHGLDILAEAGSPVRASVGGKVVAIENYMTGPLYWEVAILDADGYLWQYHHIAPDSIPKAVRTALKTGVPLAAGAELGSVISWPSSAFGVRYHHIHVNVIGGGKTYLNPLAFLEPLKDASVPEIRKIALMQNGRESKGTVIQGSYSLFADVADLVLGPKDFIVPPHSISYSLDGGPAVTVWRFDELPGERKDYVNNFFVPSMTCGDYECRRMVVDLGFSISGPKGFTRQAGPHSIVVTVEDFSGNSASKEFSWTVGPGAKSASRALAHLAAAGFGR